MNSGYPWGQNELMAEEGGIMHGQHGTEANVYAAETPGRVNLIGEHTDYSEGFVFPAAISRFVRGTVSRSSRGTTQLISHELGECEPFDVAALDPKNPPSGWARYAAGVAWAIGAQSNLSGEITSNLSTGAGLSSSAALEMTLAVLWNEIDQLGHSNKDLALLCQKAENEVVGVPCGIMDQMACAMGRQNHAMFMDTRSLDIEYVPMPSNCRVVVCHTGRSRGLVDSEYAERRASVESAARKMNVPSLRHADLEMVEMAKITDIERARARHVVTENQRCRDFASALNAGDHESVGRLMEESHESLRVDFEVSCPELDAMASAARRIEGCIGARMTGAGFGGCCVALVHQDRTSAFARELEAAYKAAFPNLVSEIGDCSVADGARLVAAS